MNTATPSLPARLNALALVNEWVQEETALLGGELPEWLEDLQMLAEADVREKASRIGKAIIADEQRIAAIEQEQDRLAARAATFTRAIERRKEYLRACMNEAGVFKIVSDLVTVSVCGNGGKQKITWDAVAPPPLTLCKTRELPPPQFDPEVARAILTATQELPNGCTLHPRGEHVRVK